MAELDIKELIEELVKKIAADEALKKKFMSEPISVLEKLLGVDLPNEQLEGVVNTIKAKVDLDKVSDLLGGLGSLFGKK